MLCDALPIEATAVVQGPYSSLETRLANMAELERLGDEIAKLAAHLHAATYRLLVMLRDFDERDGWGRGFRSCAHWLSWRTGIALGAAREKMRVARALQHLPRISASMERGQLSFAKVRAITRVATPANEEQLLELAQQGTASHLERIVRAWRRVDRLEEQFLEQRRHEGRELTLHIDDDGMYVLRGRLDPEVGAVLERALAAASEVLYGRRAAAPGANSARDVQSATIGQRRADAIGIIAECALRGELAAARLEADGHVGEREPEPQAQRGPEAVVGTDPSRRRVAGRGDRFLVVVHGDAEALRESSDAGQSLLGGARVSAETSRRIACDCSRAIMAHDGDGKSVDIGRRARTIPPAIRRALEHRDRGCRFPGCGLRYCDAHHIKHWIDGGATRLTNLLLLCRRHHRAVHEEGFRIVVGSNGETTFYRPDGRPLPHAPPLPHMHDGAGELEATSRALGLTINASTAMSGWRGERLDLNFAIRTLRSSNPATRST